MQDPSRLTPEAFVAELSSLGLRRAAFVYDPESGPSCSHPALEPIAEALLGNARDFDRHEAVFLEVGAETRTLLGGFLHRTRRGQGIGGVRLWRYDSLLDFLSDGLRLSRGMGRKNALAGLWWGGGKGVIARAPGTAHAEPAHRARLFRDYGAFISSLRGAYVTAEDVGTTPEDMHEIYQATRFVVCAPQRVGGSGNPSPSTAHGVVCAMEGALAHLGMGDLRGKRVAMQGVGNVGSYVIPLLLERGVSQVVAAEVSAAARERLIDRHAGAPLVIRQVKPGDAHIFAEPCDVFAPNALGGVLNPDNIARLQTKVVCGAANNQLLDQRRDAALLAERKIAYVPDFVANRMGIVNCANEQYGNIESDPAIQRHYGRDWEGSVFRVTRSVLERAQARGVTTAEAANDMADELAELEHPLFPQRTRHIVRGLLNAGWAAASDVPSRRTSTDAAFAG